LDNAVIIRPAPSMSYSGIIIRHRLDLRAIKRGGMLDGCANFLGKIPRRVADQLNLRHIIITPGDMRRHFPRIIHTLVLENSLSPVTMNFNIANNPFGFISIPFIM